MYVPRVNQPPSIRIQKDAAGRYRKLATRLEAVTAGAAKEVVEAQSRLDEARMAHHKARTKMTTTDAREEQRVRRLQQPREGDRRLWTFPAELRDKIVGHLGYHFLFKNHHGTLPKELVDALARSEMIPPPWRAAYEASRWSHTIMHTPSCARCFPWFTAARPGKFIEQLPSYPERHPLATGATFPDLRAKLGVLGYAFGSPRVQIVVAGDHGAVEFTCDNAEVVLSLIKHRIKIPAWGEVDVEELTSAGAVVGFYVPYARVKPGTRVGMYVRDMRHPHERPILARVPEVVGRCE